MDSLIRTCRSGIRRRRIAGCSSAARYEGGATDDIANDRTVVDGVAKGPLGSMPEGYASTISNNSDKIADDIPTLKMDCLAPCFGSLWRCLYNSSAGNGI